MSVWQAILLGILQGATEFLPVSSSGHLVLVPWLLGWQANDITFGAAVHLGTLVAVVYYFRHDLMALLRAGLSSLRRREVCTREERMAWMVIVGTIPAAVIGMLFDDWFEAMFATPWLVSLSLLVTAAILLGAEWLSRRTARKVEMTMADAVLVGLAQAAAIAPGISRSGSTIAAGMARGLDRPEAARFAFLLSVPVIAGAGLVELAKAALAANTTGLLLGTIGAVAAGVTGFLTIGWMMRLVRRQRLDVFAYYCIAFGILCLVVFFVKG